MTGCCAWWRFSHSPELSFGIPLVFGGLLGLGEMRTPSLLALMALLGLLLIELVSWVVA